MELDTPGLKNGAMGKHDTFLKLLTTLPAHWEHTWAPWGRSHGQIDDRYPLLSLNVPALRLGKSEWRNKAWGTEKRIINSKRRNSFISKSEGWASLESRQARRLYLWVKRQRNRHVERKCVPCKRHRLAASKDSEKGPKLEDFSVTLARSQCTYIYSNTALDTAAEMTISYEELLSPWLWVL